jgi:uncharacterized membrane protein
MVYLKIRVILTMARSSDNMGGVEKAILVVIGALIVINVLFQSATNFFPNWSSVEGIPTIIPTVMPFIVLLLFIFLVLGLVKRSRGA